MTTASLQQNTPQNAKAARGKPTRGAQLRRLLKRKSGVTLAQLQTTFGWQAHTARAAISAQRKAGWVIDRSDSDKGSVYRIVEESDIQ